MKIFLKILSLLIPLLITLSATANHHKVDLSSPEKLKTHNAVVKSVNYKGKKAIKAEISDEAKAKLAEAMRQRQAGGNQGGRLPEMRPASVT